jgi:hypothetical protein
MKRLVLDNGVAIVLYFPFFLTRYSAIFAEVKGSFKRIYIGP